MLAPPASALLLCYLILACICLHYPSRARLLSPAISPYSTSCCIRRFLKKISVLSYVSSACICSPALLSYLSLHLLALSLARPPALACYLSVLNVMLYTPLSQKNLRALLC